jgi:GTP-binding protein
VTQPDEAEAAAKLEAGRKMFARPWRHFWGSSDTTSLPATGGVEIAFAGRSNVGKSSLINALTGQKALARTSNTPGRTRELNFFQADGVPLTVVDMPGYGYARASKSDVAAWTNLAFAFLRGRPNLRRVYLLIDARHGLKDNDVEAVKLIDKAAVSYQIVLTKLDKLKGAEVDAVTAGISSAISKHAAAHPAILATSSETGTGIDALRAEIAALA